MGPPAIGMRNIDSMIHAKNFHQSRLLPAALFALVATLLPACSDSRGEANKDGMSREANEAAQALRLLGAVQITNFTTARGYATPDELKKAQLLDPEWPRTRREHYRITCDVSPDKEKFVCFADAIRGGDPWFRIDDSQRLRTETARRPTDSSPILGLPKTGGKR